MIQTFTFTVPLKEPDTADTSLQRLRDEVMKLAAFNQGIRGFTAAADAGTVRLSLRYAGRNRWQISAQAKKVVTLSLQRSGLGFRDATFVSVVSEETARNLTLPQGRLPKMSPKRVLRDPDWKTRDYGDWWGDIPTGQ